MAELTSERVLEGWSEVRSHLKRSGSIFADIALDTEACARLATYFEFLSSWTTKIDLVSPGSARELFREHGLDALAAWAVVSRETSPGRVLDVGSGAGLPGMVWGCIAPESSFVLCEPREKRVVFLQEARRRLGLANLRVERGRLEALSPGVYDRISFRALRPEGALLGAAVSQLAPGGRVVWLTGADKSLITAEAVKYSLPGDTKGRKLLEIKTAE